MLQGAFFHLVGGIWPTKTKLCSIYIICRAQLRGKITYLLRQHADLRFQNFDGMCVVRCENLDEPQRSLGIWLMNFRDPCPSLGHSCSSVSCHGEFRNNILTFPKTHWRKKMRLEDKSWCRKFYHGPLLPPSKHRGAATSRRRSRWVKRWQARRGCKWSSGTAYSAWKPPKLVSPPKKKWCFFPNKR